MGGKRPEREDDLVMLEVDVVVQGQHGFGLDLPTDIAFIVKILTRS